MVQDNYAISHNFSSKNHYLFVWEDGIPGKRLPVVGNLTQILDDKILFIFQYDIKTEQVWVKKEDIIAVRNDIEGTYIIKEFQGKYTILNEILFRKNIGKGIIEIEAIT